MPIYLFFPDINSIYNTLHIFFPGPQHIAVICSWHIPFNKLTTIWNFWIMWISKLLRTINKHIFQIFLLLAWRKVTLIAPITYIMTLIQVYWCEEIGRMWCIYFLGIDCNNIVFCLISYNFSILHFIVFFSF